MPIALSEEVPGLANAFQIILVIPTLGVGQNV
jgi:hypothetical protein